LEEDEEDDQDFVSDAAPEDLPPEPPNPGRGSHLKVVK
jgi:stringent starvation protein B